MGVVTLALETAKQEYRDRFTKKIYDGSDRVLNDYFASRGNPREDHGAAWCAAFVNWCINEACKLTGRKNLFINTVSCPEIYKDAKERKFLRKRLSVPVPGDVFLRCDHGYPEETMAGHTGFVFKVEGNSFLSVEGNTTDGTSPDKDTVCEKWHPISGTPDKNWFMFVDTAKIFGEESLPLILDTADPLELMHEIYRTLDKVDMDELSKNRILIALNSFNRQKEIKALFDKYREAAPKESMPDMLPTALKFTLKWEGGLSDHPADPGGRTNMGITHSVYDAYRKEKGLPIRDVSLIEMWEVQDIYREKYWKASKADTMVNSLAIVHFDTAVNFGVNGAVMFLQEAFGFSGGAVDGKFGSDTTKALQANNNKATALKIVDGRIAYRHERVRKNPGQKVFLEGWLNRDNDLKKFIVNM